MVKIPIEIIEMILGWVDIRSIERFMRAARVPLEGYLESRIRAVFSESMAEIRKINYSIKIYNDNIGLDIVIYAKSLRNGIKYKLIRRRGGQRHLNLGCHGETVRIDRGRLHVNGMYENDDSMISNRKVDNNSNCESILYTRILRNGTVILITNGMYGKVVHGWDGYQQN